MASSAGLDVASFLDEASGALASAVPNENHLNGPYWYTLDPESRLDRSARRSLPASIASAASAALACARAENPPEESTLLVRSIDGCWISVHGTVIGVGRTARAAVIIESAHPDRVTPLLMAIHGLTPREREVTRLVLQGRSTTQIANRLGISAHTVQQHMKGIFEKVGVRSRRDLVGAVFFENFEPRVRDNGQRVSVEKPIRGGPLRRVH